MSENTCFAGILTSFLVYRIGFVGHLFLKCDEMSLVFYRKNTSYSSENSFEFVFNGA